jgi:hypothetical protein
MTISCLTHTHKINESFFTGAGSQGGVLHEELSRFFFGGGKSFGQKARWNVVVTPKSTAQAILQINPFARLVYLQGQSMMFHKLNNSLKSEPLHVSSLIFPSYHLLLHYMNEWPTTLLGIRWFLSLRRNSHDAPLSHPRVRHPPPG